MCSGAGLHVGHPEGYTATDIIARYKVRVLSLPRVVAGGGTTDYYHCSLPCGLLRPSAHGWLQRAAPYGLGRVWPARGAVRIRHWHAPQRDDEAQHQPFPRPAEGSCLRLLRSYQRTCALTLAHCDSRLGFPTIGSAKLPLVTLLITDGHRHETAATVATVLSRRASCDLQRKPRAVDFFALV